MRKARYVAGPKAIGSFIGKSARKVLVKRGFAHADILAKWPSIVGPTLSGFSSPERLSFTRHKNRDASLKVRVAPGHAPEFQHFEPLIIERINSFFGYRAVGRLQIVQAPVKRPKIAEKPSISPPSEEQMKWLEDALMTIEDKDLKENLHALGAALITKKKS